MRLGSTERGKEATQHPRPDETLKKKKKKRKGAAESDRGVA